jgi:hypothetical protein
MENYHQIEVWFLVLSLFLPRVALLVAYCSNAIPPNTIPFWGDVVMAALIPRILILIYIATCMGLGGWFWAHLVVAILAYANGVRIKAKSKS